MTPLDTHCNRMTGAYNKRVPPNKFMNESALKLFERRREKASKSQIQFPGDNFNSDISLLELEDMQDKHVIVNDISMFQSTTPFNYKTEQNSLKNCPFGDGLDL